MAVNITWSSTEGGTGFTSLAHGDTTIGIPTDQEIVYLRHDGSNAITNCKIYLGPKSGIYTGDVSAAADYAELISWGDASVSYSWGGVQINMNAEGSFDGGSTWGMSESQKTSTDGLKFTIRTATGNQSSTAVTLSEKMSSGMSTDGTIPAALTSARFAMRILVPEDENTAGAREFELFTSYTYTN